MYMPVKLLKKDMTGILFLLDLIYYFISGQSFQSRTVILRNMSSDTSYKFETLAVSKLKDYVMQVEMNRPEKRNAMNMEFYR